MTTKYPYVRILASGTIAYAIREPDHNGVVRHRTITRDEDSGEKFKSEYQASQARKRHEARIAGGKRAASRQTLDEYLRTWLKGREGLTGSSRYTYRYSINRIGALGAIPLSELTAADLRAWEQNALETYAPKTIQMTHRTLKLALEDAVEWEMIPRNPLARVHPPASGADPAKPLSPEDARTFTAVADRDDELAAFWRLSITTGARIGELLALQWSDVDFNVATITIRRTVARDADGHLVIGDAPKTRAGERIIPIPPAAINALRLKRDASQFRRPPSQFVFPGNTGRPRSYAFVYRRRDLILKEAGLEHCRIHDLRHTAATIMLARGVPVSTVAGILGHSSPAVTLEKYAGYIPVWGREALADFERFLDASG